MSRDNVELVRQGLEAWQRNDFDSWLATLDLAVEWHTGLERLVEGTESFYRGQEEMRRFWHDYRTEFQDFQVEAEELRDLGDDRVVLLGLFRWRGLASGIATESPLGMVFTVRGGKIIQSVDYLSQQDALKAVGLQE